MVDKIKVLEMTPEQSHLLAKYLSTGDEDEIFQGQIYFLPYIDEMGEEQQYTCTFDHDIERRVRYADADKKGFQFEVKSADGKTVLASMVQSDEELIAAEAIEVLEMTSEQSRLLAHYLNSCAEDVLLKGQVYFLPYFDELGEEQQYICTFDHDIVRRVRNADKKGYRFEVKSNVRLGSGATADVYEVAATLKPLLNGELICKIKEEDKLRIIKVLKPGEVMTPAEYELMRELGFRIKEPVTVTNKNGETVTYIVMGIGLGRELFDVINDHHKGIHQLSTKQILLLALALWRALKEQVHDHGVVHRDLSPGNALVKIPDDENEMPIVKIIDFGLSKKAGVKDDRRGGTPGYISPEALAGKNTDARSDAFSMAVMVFLLCGIKVSGGEYIKETDKFTKYSIDSEGIPDDCLEGLSQDDKDEIYFLHQSISDENPDCRVSADAAIALFDKLILERKLSEKSLPDETNIRNAHKAALEARRDLREVELKRVAAADAAVGIKATIEKYAKNVNSPEDIEEFIATLEVKAFVQQASKTKEDLLQLTDDILTGFKESPTVLNDVAQQYAQLQLLYDNLAQKLPQDQQQQISSMGIELAQILLDLEEVLDKQQKYGTKLDDMVAYCLLTGDAADSFTVRVQAVEKKLGDAEFNFVTIPLNNLRQQYITKWQKKESV